MLKILGIVENYLDKIETVYENLSVNIILNSENLKAFPLRLGTRQGCLFGFPGGSDGKASACNAGDPGSIPGSGRSPGEGNGNPLQSSCLKNSMDRGTCRLKSMRSQELDMT